jgi:acetyl esterase/lipase
MRIAALTFSILWALMASALAAEPVKIPLWKDGAPGTPATKPADEPVMFLYRPSAGAANGTAIVVCPGGGYGFLAMDHEGKQIAEWFNSMGVTAFVLQYRHNGSGHRHPVPMMDGQRAIRTVRARATEWGIDPGKIGVIGFSAGGHLASTLGTHFDSGRADAADPIERAGSRPDFMILCYPVISMTAPFTHAGSRENLLGKHPGPDLARLMSNELQVTSDTPPTFLWTTNEDTLVPCENSIAFFEALRKVGVPAELHIYERGSHGKGLAPDVPGTNAWPKACHDWLASRGLLKTSDDQ